MSFTNWNVFGKADWVGLANFQRLIGDGSFRISVVNTLYYSAMHIPLTIVVSLGLALLLNNKLRGVAFFRTAAFFPYITSIVAIAVVWNLLFSPDTARSTSSSGSSASRTLPAGSPRPSGRCPPS